LANPHPEIPPNGPTPRPDAAPPVIAGDDKPARKRPAPMVRYVGFRTTTEGREYTLQVTSEAEPRIFVLLIPHQAFADRKLSFQDAPAFCFTRLQRDLVADPDLAPGIRRLMTGDELREYREETAPHPPVRKRRRPSI
jgi:hypothetical protein